MEMDFLSSVNTSLELNTYNSLELDENLENKEMQANLVELGRKISVEDETSALVEELNRVKAENKRLAEMLTIACDKYNSLRNHCKDYVIKNQIISKKRKVTSDKNIENDNINGSNLDNHSSSRSSNEDSCNIKKTNVEVEHVKTKISRISVRTEISDTSIVVNDGYQWRKYGQKVTRDNLCPRAYFKCSLAPTCPVKKKVQRSSQDPSIVVATYEGEHNHPNPSKLAEQTSSPSHSLTLGSAHDHNSSGPTRPNPTEPDKPNNNIRIDSSSHVATKSFEFQQFLVEQMASNLTKDPGFKAALAAAITGKFVHQ